jgi:hypothetical protein
MHIAYYDMMASAVVIKVVDSAFSLHRLITDEEIVDADNPKELFFEAYRYIVHKWNAEGPYKIEALQWFNGWLIFKEGHVDDWMFDIANMFKLKRVIAR